MSAVSDLNDASARAKQASLDFQTVVEGDDLTTVTTSGGRSLPTISKWFKDSYNSLSSFISTEADRAEVSANSANSSKDNANTDALLAKDWASKTQGFKVDGVRYSAFHYSLAANTAKNLAETSATGSASSASASSTSAYNSSIFENRASLWASHTVDVLVPGEAFYSARHYAKKAEDFAAVIGGGIALTTPYTITGNAFPANPSSAQIRRISLAGTIGTESYEANDFIIYDHTTGTDQWFKLTANGVSKTQFSVIDADTKWNDNRRIFLGNSSDMSLRHTGSNGIINVNTGHFYLSNLSQGDNFYLRATPLAGGVFTFLTCDPDGDLRLSRSQSTITMNPTGTTINVGASDFNVTGLANGKINVSDLILKGTSSLTLDATSLDATSKLININSAAAGSPSTSAVYGLSVNRGSSPTRTLLFDETDAAWEIDGQRLFSESYHPKADSLTNSFNIILTGKVNGSTTTNGTGSAIISVSNVDADKLSGTALSQLYKVGVGLNYMQTGLIELGSGSFTDGNLRFIDGGADIDSSLSYSKFHNLFSLSGGAWYGSQVHSRGKLNKPAIIQTFNMNTSGNPVLGFYVHAYNGAAGEILGGVGDSKTNSSSWMELTESALTIFDEDLIVGDASTTKFHVDMVNKKLSLTDMSLEIDGSELAVITTGTWVYSVNGLLAGLAGSDTMRWTKSVSNGVATVTFSKESGDLVYTPYDAFQTDFTITNWPAEIIPPVTIDPIYISVLIGDGVTYGDKWSAVLEIDPSNTDMEYRLVSFAHGLNFYQQLTTIHFCGTYTYSVT